MAHGEAEVAADEKGWLWLLEEESCGRKGEAMPMRIWVGGGGWAIVFHDGAEVVVAVNTMEREGRATMAGEKPGGGWLKTETNRFEPVSVFFIKKISVCTEQKMITPTCIHPCKQLWFKTMLDNKNQRVNL